MTDKEKIRAEIERLMNHFDSEYDEDPTEVKAAKGNVCHELLSFIDSLQEEPVSKDKCIDCNNVKGCVTCVDGSEWAHYEEPDHNNIQYTSRAAAIQAHADDYSFNIESELFQQLTPEQQGLWRKDIEQAVKSGGYCGLHLATDKRYDQEEPVSAKDKLRALSGGERDLGWLKDAKDVERYDGINDDLRSLVDKESVVLWKEINSGNRFSIVDSFNQFYGICMQVAESAVEWQNKREEPVSDGLEVAAHRCYESNDRFMEGFKKGAKWQKETLWKSADGDDLPDIDREVVALLDNGTVVFAHRPPEFWDGKNIDTGKVTRYYPKTHDKGGWNIPNVKWWLDCSLPNMEED